ncbi:TOM1-like protein 5 isoform X1 [Bidens hawaiensis]|uniref:TOM1-like protein 5 isoform X1 n=2 Tax=Bidens hawaiensis TaxID=980011 RepID=UPI004049DB07
MAAELVNAATSDKLTEMDWTKSIEICELVARDHRQAKDVIKAIKKRLGSKSKDTQLFAVMLLEMLMNNIGEPIHTQVIDNGILPVLVKIVKKKSDLPVREKIFLLLDATQTSVGGASGRFPQYYNAYYDLVSSGVTFSQNPRPEVLPKNRSTSDSSKSNSSNGEPATAVHDRSAPQEAPPPVPESSIVQKAGSALEVLRDVLDAIDARYPEQAKDEFTLDLVEQCSFHKQRVMHLAVTSRDEKTISQAIELNDQLQKALTRHDDLVSGRPMSALAHVDHEQAEEEEDPEQLFRRMRKGKACVRPEAENHQPDRPLGLLGSSVPPDRLNRPLIRPISLEPKQEPITALPSAAVSLPPPPAKHVERERFFQENKNDGSALGGHMRSLSLHSRNASSSRSGSFDFSD